MYDIYNTLYINDIQCIQCSVYYGNVYRPPLYDIYQMTFFKVL
jgi:hypothetical protein